MLTVEEANAYVAQRTGGEVGVRQTDKGVVLYRKGFDIAIALHPDMDLEPGELDFHLNDWKNGWPNFPKPR